MANSFNKFIVAGTTAAIVATAVAPAALASGLPFKDVSSSYEEAVTFLYEWEIINGKSPTTFGTNLNLTRGDAAVIMANALGLDTENAPDAGFTDLIPRIEGSVNALAEYGIISGVNKTTFAPNEPLTRGAMAKVLSLGFGLEPFAKDAPYKDAVGAFGPYVDILYGTGITKGKTVDSFGTNLNITRGEFANLLFRTFTFLGENIYIPYATNAELLDSNTLRVTLEEEAPAEYPVQELAEGIYVAVELEDGTILEPTVSNAVLSDDRTTVTFDLSTDLNGEKGFLYADDFELEFDFVQPTTESTEVPGTVGSEDAGTLQLTVTE